MTNIECMDGIEIARRVRMRDFSVVEVAEVMMERIEALGEVVPETSDEFPIRMNLKERVRCD